MWSGMIRVILVLQLEQWCHRLVAQRGVLQEWSFI